MKVQRAYDATEVIRPLPLSKLQKLEEGGGEVVRPLGMSLTWKVKGKDTGYAFSVYEMTLQPGEQIPLHVHPQAEFFQFLEGQADIMGLDDAGKLTYTPITAGECATAPINVPHGIKNRSQAPVTFTSTSTYEHQLAFDDYAALMKTPEGQALDKEEQIDALYGCFGDYRVFYLGAQER